MWQIVDINTSSAVINMNVTRFSSCVAERRRHVPKLPGSRCQSCVWSTLAWTCARFHRHSRTVIRIVVCRNIHSSVLRYSHFQVIARHEAGVRHFPAAEPTLVLSVVMLFFIDAARYYPNGRKVRFAAQQKGAGIPAPGDANHASLEGEADPQAHVTQRLILIRPAIL
jgi:hypothetical protein